MHSWGEIGHRSTGRIAHEFLNENAKNSIDDILASYKGPDNKTFKTIFEIATYPDEIRPLVPWANTYHYLNMRKNETKYNEMTQCSSPAYCIVKALQNYTSILRDRSIIDISRLGEALSFTVHFMGDFFQPLHAGNLEDAGGNNIKIKLSEDWKVDNRSSDLHWCWDHLVLLHFMNAVLNTNDLNVVYKYFLDEINSKPDFKKQYLNKKADFVAIAEESRSIVISDVYDKMKNYNFDNLTVTYFNDTIALIQEQVMKSGLQMAKLLNDIFDERTNRASGLSNTLILILNLFLILILIQNECF